MRTRKGRLVLALISAATFCLQQVTQAQTLPTLLCKNCEICRLRCRIAAMVLRFKVSRSTSRRASSDERICIANCTIWAGKVSRV